MKKMSSVETCLRLKVVRDRNFVPGSSRHTAMTFAMNVMRDIAEMEIADRRS